MYPVRSLARANGASPEDLGGVTSYGMKNLDKGFALTEMIIVLTVLSVVGATTIGYYEAVKIRQAKQAARPTTTRSIQRTITVKLEPQGGSGRSGIAVLAELQGKVKVVMNLSGPSVGVLRPAHIHVGSCPGVGEVKYPLTSLKDGASQTDLDVSLDELMTQLPLAINVHKSPEEPSIYLACGNIQ